MHIIKFGGYVLPSAIRATFNGFPDINWEIRELGITATFQVRIDNGMITVECSAPMYEDSHMVFFYMRALDICRAQVDLLGLRQGLGLTVILDTYIDSYGTKTDLVFSHPDIVSLIPCLNEDQDFGAIFTEAIRDHSLGYAIHDLVEAISAPHASIINCARAVEGLKNLIAPGKKPETWDTFRMALNLDRDYVMFVTELSQQPRHGHRVYFDGKTTTEVVNRSVTILNRFLEYRKRGSQPLPVAEFALLKSQT